jgi:exopolysaccharide biosynthesis polyprenyl glycosylphosphotransferase
MIRRHMMALRIGLMLGDGISAILVFLAVSVLRFRDGDAAVTLWATLGIDIRAAAVLFAVTWVAVLWISGLYRITVRWRLWTEVRDIARATLLAVALTLSFLFLVKQVDVSRLFLLLLFITQPTVTFLGRMALRIGFETARKRGMDPRYMLVAGSGKLAQQFADRVERHPGLGLRIIGHLAAPEEREATVTRPILGSINDIEDVLHSQVVDEVAVCLPPVAAHYLEPITGLAAGEGKTVRIPVDPAEGVPSTAIQEDFDGFLVSSLIHDGQREAALVLKRVIDVVLSALGLVLLGIPLLIVAIAIRVTDGSPVFFRQVRVGLHGRPFTIHKFRTMVVDAEERLDEVRHLNERTGAAFKASDDPRMTPIGRWLRRTSIDELPQLWDVLTGSMSLVGPRPPLPSEVAEYDIWHRRRLSMKPGITGLWQIEARHDPDFDRWVEHDLLYIDGWSIWLDLKILLKTIPALVAHGGQ